jgi:hypothetical protein
VLENSVLLSPRRITSEGQLRVFKGGIHRVSKVLYSSGEVRNAIVKIFGSSHVRRVAISAFVGDGAESYLPNPKGLELICWPKAGGTNPDELRKLIRRGAKVYFADALHMKIYWADGKGAVLASANLSTNALGSGNLKEAGILLKSNEIDIDRILRSVNRRKVSQAAIHKLDELHKAYIATNPKHVIKTPRQITFPAWYKDAFRSQWKLGWYDASGTVSSNAKEKANKEYAVSEPHDFMNVRRRDFKTSDWVLSFALEKNFPRRLSWMFVDFIVPISRSDKKAYSRDYPFQAVQVWGKNRYAGCPFKIDNRFRTAFSQVISEYGGDRVKSLTSLTPSRQLIARIYKHY